MTVWEALLLLGTGILASFLNVTSGGGSLVSLPVLIFLGLPPTIANASNRIGIISQNLFAVAGFRSKGVHAWPYSLYIALSAFLGAIIGAKISVDLSDDIFQKVIAIVMVGVVLLTVFNSKKTNTIIKENMSVKAQVLGVIVFFFVGIYGGFIQAGVGFIMIAALTGINGFSLVKTNSAKVFVALIYTLSAVAVFIYEDVINWTYGLTLAAGNAIGGWLTSRWSVKKGDKWIKRILVITVTALAIKLWFY
ncbi:sulfite exporter TauE/SafE family protein [Fulvivirga lutea]|uniref:Probable membrane transporter protein n=1 Tax=Fulvivirga lutea TaxID=2810512 RepID=A0A974WMX9_9BACT|nr:sulfite exporter TauE/SafE family protein [Fulvivirga lutea]QSE99245.1 sulfite exporter TauE/SafE family protein [Fulvivirga lutea]